MSVSGVVLSVDVERYGDTLAADTLATDVVLQVDDIVDFADEDDFAAGPQWLVIGDSDPMQYVSVDDDADTVTLATAVGAVYEAGEPVRMWDPTIGDSGGEVVGYLCWVELDEGDEDDQPIPVEVTHDRVVYFGVDNLAGLIGARVSLEPDDDDPESWHIADIIGRSPVLDAGAISTPYVSLYMSADVSVPTATFTPATGWTVRTSRGFPFIHATEGRVWIQESGTYLVTATARFAANSTGGRTITIQRMDWGGTYHDERSVTITPIVGSPTLFQAMISMPINGGDWMRFVVRQSSGAALDLMGGTPQQTALEIAWVAP